MAGLARLKVKSIERHDVKLSVNPDESCKVKSGSE